MFIVKASLNSSNGEYKRHHYMPVESPAHNPVLPKLTLEKVNDHLENFSHVYYITAKVKLEYTFRLNNMTLIVSYIMNSRSQENIIF